MKKILALSLAFAAFTMSVSAQEKRETSTGKKAMHQRMHGDHKKQMMKDINLSDAQKTQLKAIHDDKSLTKEDRKAKMQGIFTPDQKATLAKNKSNMQAQRKEMHEKRAKEMQTKLGLSNEQSAKLKSQNEVTHSQMKAIKENNSLTKEAKKEKMKAIKAQAKEQRKTVLSADQQKKWDDMKKEHKGKRHGENKTAK